MTLTEASSPPLAETFDGITTISLVGNRDKAKGRRFTAASLSYPVTPIRTHHDSQPLWILTTPCATDSPNWPQLWLQTTDHFSKTGPRCLLVGKQKWGTGNHVASLEHLGLDDAPKPKQGSLGRKNKTKNPPKLHDHLKIVLQCVTAKRLG